MDLCKVSHFFFIFAFIGVEMAFLDPKRYVISQRMKKMQIKADLSMQLIGNMELPGSQNIRNIQMFLLLFLVSFCRGRNGLPGLNWKCEWTKNEKIPETS